MIIGAIFFGFVAACALVLLFVIVKSAVEDARAAETAPQPRRVVLPGDREGRFVREGEGARRPVAH